MTKSEPISVEAVNSGRQIGQIAVTGGLGPVLP
jgi:hypothetical protein